MKLTLEIPNERTADILAMLAAMLNPAPVQAQPDPAEGHPELPLTLPTPQAMSVDEWSKKWIEAGGDVPPTPEQLKAIQCGVHAHNDEDPAFADVRWQATPEPVTEPDPWDLPPYTEAKPAEFASNSEGKLEII